jgi:hypothetical protein
MSPIYFLDVPYTTSMSPQGLGALSCTHVPKFDSLEAATTNDGLTIWTEGYIIYQPPVL